MTNPQAILLVEDDESLGYVIRDSLNHEGFSVTWCRNGDDALQYFTQGSFSICLVDVMLPKKDGFALVREIRDINREVPVLFITARAMTEDKLTGFRSGGDDYITKPFSMEELVHRIRVFIRRSGRDNSREQAHLIGQFEFHSGSLYLKHPTTTVTLTSKEAQVLEVLCQNQHRVLKREEILNGVWGDDDYFMGRSLDVYISKLRKYLKADPGVQIINYHGIGFRLEIKKN